MTTSRTDVTLGATAVDRDVLRLSGADTVSFLQGQLSQDVEALSTGTSAWSLLLQPQGKIDAWIRIHRISDTEVLIDVDGGWGDAVVTRLERFKLRVDVTIDRLDWSVVALRGPGAADVEAPEGARAADAEWSGIEAIDLLGPSIALPAGIAERPLVEYEALRIESGVPAMGTELDDSTIPAEAGIVDRSASFTKGCYTGQELVARIDSRGSNTPRNLCKLIVDGEGDFEPGVGVTQNGEPVGLITSAAWSSERGATVALAYLKRSADVPGPVAVDGRPAQALALP